MKLHVEQPHTLARRLRAVLANQKAPISHKKSLDFVATLGGMNNWLAVTKGQSAHADIELDRAGVLRLCEAVQNQLGIKLHPTGLMARLRDTVPRRQGSLPVELRQDQIPTFFKRFSEAIGPEHWLAQVQRVERDIARNYHLRSHLPKQNSVAIALATASEATKANSGRLPINLTNTPNLMEGFGFAFQSMGMINAARQVSNKKAIELIHRIRNAFAQPGNIRTMQLEATVATHFLRRGHRVSFPELSYGRETFDVIVEDLGPQGLELECKVITHDKGRKIHRLESYEFFHLMEPTLDYQSHRIQGGLAIVITIPGRMPATEAMPSLVQAISVQIASGTGGTLSDGTEIKLVEFPKEVLGKLTNPPSELMRSTIDKLTDTENREVFFFAPGNRPCVIVAILQSANPDSMLHETFATLAESAGVQLTGKRPGAFIAGLQDIGSDKLLELASEERTTGIASALTQHVHMFLSRPEFPHVIGVGFFSEFRYGDFTDKGTTYYFPKHASEMWDEAYSGMFGPDLGPAFLQPLSQLKAD